MKVSKLFALAAMTAVLVFAFAAFAYAGNGNDSQGTVYGQATMQPTVSIQISGTGSDSSNPLVYWGRKGQFVQSVGWSQVTLTNNGDVDVPILLGYGSNPTDGSDTWNFADSPGSTDCVWTIMGNLGGTNVPAFDGAPRQLYPSFAPGRSDGVNTYFTFPTTFNGNAHGMTALFIAGGES
jgi:hypothetical protein